MTSISKSFSALLLASALALPIAFAANSSAQTDISLSQTDSDQILSAPDQKLLLSLLERGNAVELQMRSDAVAAAFDAAWIAPTLEIINFIDDPSIRTQLFDHLREETGQGWGRDVNRWFRWLWNEPPKQIQGYDQFKADFYVQIDKRFARYFEGRGDNARIRLDEVRWGGVKQDGIPPLHNPKMLSASEANYLEDDNIVFGIEVNGDFRAYPKRILAWHEMFTDRVGGVDVAGVYCTLCGTVILYDTAEHDLGTSGFLYRSNKLMYDKATQSLWNTLTGEPVVGPLVGQDIALDHRSVVTTTWGKWKTLHPDTKVLSRNTGYRRDYAEGVAYHDYFATDNLMFNTPFVDSRLANKQEILALRFKGQGGKSLAVDTNYLKANPVYSGNVGTQKFVVLTDETGANRVYDPGDIKFTQLKDQSVTDSMGQSWAITESRLTAPDGRQLKRLPYHRAFWFGWQAAYPNTELVK
jgi:hypothetical protein